MRLLPSLRRRLWPVLILAGLLGGIFAFGTSRGPKHEGRTAAEWLRHYCERVYLRPTRNASTAEVQLAFRAMGTNAVPYLAGRITGTQVDSSMENRWRQLREWAHLVPTPTRRMQAEAAALLLAHASKPPGEMLVPLLERAFSSPDPQQRANALVAVRGISSGDSLAKP